MLQLWIKSRRLEKEAFKKQKDLLQNMIAYLNNLTKFRI